MSQAEWFKTLGVLIVLTASLYFLGRRIKKLGGNRLFEVCAAALAVMTITITILSGNIHRGRRQAVLAKCEETLKKLGPLYLDDGKPDPELAKVACPASGIPFEYREVGKGYVLVCSGQAHPEAYTKLAKDYPRFVSSSKKVTRGPLLVPGG